MSRIPTPDLRPRRLAVAALAAAGLLLAGCAGEDEGAAPLDVPTVSATAAPPDAAATSEPAPSATPDDAQVVSATVGGGRVTGVEPRTPVRLGTRVRLTVTSDVADEVHVHGFEITEPVTVGQTFEVEFVADRPGVFEVELHDARLVLTRLQVQ